jgi:hypothetical protein
VLTGLWLAPPKNGNISNVGRRLSAISLPSCSNWEYRDGQQIHKKPQLAGTYRILRANNLQLPDCLAGDAVLIAPVSAQALPGNVTDQVPEAKNLLFVKLPDRVLLIDPDSKLVTEIVMEGATTGSNPNSSDSSDRPSR